MAHTFNVFPERNPAARSNYMMSGRNPSPAYCRFYNWLSNNGVGIGSFSTDACVDRLWDVLQDARKQLALWVANPPTDPNCAKKEDIESMLGQMDNILRRGTKNRITTVAQATKAQATLDVGGNLSNSAESVTENFTPQYAPVVTHTYGGNDDFDL